MAAANIPWSKIIPVCTTAIAEVTKDLADAQTPGKITFEEAIASFQNICTVAGLTFDNENAQLALLVAQKFIKALADKVLTIAEVVEIGEAACALKGIRFDKTGFTLPV